MTTDLILTALGVSTQKRFSFEIILWLAVLVAACVLLAVAALWVRRRLMGRAESSPIGFTLADLRQMHAQGQLSDEELAAAEARTLKRSRAHYLGDADRDDAAGAENDVPGPGPDSSTNDPPPDQDGPDNPPDAPDKNADGGPLG